MSISVEIPHSTLAYPPYTEFEQQLIRKLL